MALTETFVRNGKHAHGVLYLLVKASGNYRRLDSRGLGKRKTPALGVYPAVTLIVPNVSALHSQVLLQDRGIFPKFGEAF